MTEGQALLFQFALIGAAVVMWIAAGRIRRRIPWLNQPKPKRDAASFLFEERPVRATPPASAIALPVQPYAGQQQVLSGLLLQQPLGQIIKLSTIALEQNVLVVGPKGSGKTTLLRKVLATRAAEQMYALDPHAAPGKWPCQVIGGGRDYAAIGTALVQIERAMDARFKQLSSGERREGEFERRSVVTDEYRSIADKLNGKGGTVDAGALLLNRISEGRKVGECALVACHNDTGEALGIQGNTDMKTCFDWIVYMGGLVDSNRTQRCPQEVKAEALKRERPAVAWLTEKNQWFVLYDDLPMPNVSSVSPVVMGSNSGSAVRTSYQRFEPRSGEVRLSDAEFEEVQVRSSGSNFAEPASQNPNLNLNLTPDELRKLVNALQLYRESGNKIASIEQAFNVKRGAGKEFLRAKALFDQISDETAMTA